MNALSTDLHPEGALSLADVRRSVALAATGTNRRDTLCAFDVLVARMDLDLAATTATVVAVRRAFESAKPVGLGLTARRYANIRSLVLRAVERFGVPGVMSPTRSTPLSPQWASLLETTQPAAHRKGVRRLAQYCSALGVPPEAVCRDTLLGMHDAVEAEGLVKEPQRIIRGTIGSWNIIGRATPGWPPVVLGSP